MLDRFFRLPGLYTDRRKPSYSRPNRDSLRRQLFKRPLGYESLEDRWLLAATLPAGFTDIQVAGGINGPTAMEFSPDGRLWVLEQSGNIKLVHNDGSTFTALHLNVDGNGERGLLGIAFDPGFQTNHYVYLYYTNPNAASAAWAGGTHNQLSRFTVNDANPQQPTLTAEAPILDWNKLSTATNHNGGAIHFGADGMLYADAGDNVQTFTGPNGTSYRVSQSLDTLLGKQLRIDVSKFNSGGATRDDVAVGHLIPANNPFVGKATGINQLIYVMGLRNPFTFAVQPGTGRMLINDVGETNWEEINEGIAGANYGWSGGNTDGFGHPQPSFAAGTYREPLLAYAHSGTGSLATGAALVGSTFYNPPTVQFPASYVGMYFYEDLSSGWIRYFNPNNPNAAANPDGNSVAFAKNTPGALRDLKVDAVGSLYYLSGADGSIHKISYQSPKITTQPTNQTANQGQAATFTVVATGPGLSYQWQHQVNGNWNNVGGNSANLTLNNVQTADGGNYRVTVSNTFGATTSNTAMLTVNVAGAAPTITTQPTNQQAGTGAPVTFSVVASGATPMTYQWQHQVNGNWNNVGTNATSYTIGAVAAADAGNYRVVVSNSKGTATSNTATLTINQLPSVTITSPTASTMYNWEQTVNFSATATDPEDGTLPASKLSWEIRFYHQDEPDGTGLHFHPFQNFTGVANGSIVTNFPETLQYVWYRFIVTATDSKGGTTSQYVDIRPNLQSFTLQSNPPGLQLMLDGGPIASGTTITGTIGQPRTIGVVSPQTSGNNTYNFNAWSDGGAASHDINIPNTKTTFTANFTAGQQTSSYHLEAENFTLTHYQIENNTSASGGKVISLKNDGPTGTAKTTFNGPTGQYQVVAGVYDENDGVSPMSVQFGTAAPMTFKLDGNFGDADANAKTHITRNLGVVQLTQGQTITLGGTNSMGEYARWDYLDLIATSQASNQTPTTTPTPTPTKATVLAINAGGPAVANFMADRDFTGGGVGSTTHAIDLSGVTNPAPMSVYQTWNNNAPAYTIPNLTPGATYLVRLHFAENIATATGQRVQNISINGTRVLTSFDIFAEVGAFKAEVKEFSATADSSGKITINFQSVVGPTRISGIEIVNT